MQHISRTSFTRDIENPAETIISGDSFLRPVIESTERETRKSVTFQQINTGSFDNYIESKKKK